MAAVAWPRAGAAAALLLAAAGCETGPPLQARLQPFVDKTEAELVSVLGVPYATYEAGGLKFLQFTDQRTQIVPGDPWWGARPWGRWGPLYAPPYYIVRSCEVTFSLRGGIVVGFSFRGDGCR